MIRLASKVSPRVAGILCMLAALAIAALAIVMIAHPATSLIGVVVLVLATVLFALASTWMFRPTWAKNSWAPTKTLNPAQVRRLRRRLLVFYGAALVVMVAGLIWSIAVGGISEAPYFTLLVLLLNGANMVILTKGANRTATTVPENPAANAHTRDSDPGTS